MIWTGFVKIALACFSGSIKLSCAFFKSNTTIIFCVFVTKCSSWLKNLESKRAILKYATSSYLKVYDPREKLFYTVNGFIQQWVVGTQVAIRGRTVQHQLSRPRKQEVNPEVNFFQSFVVCGSPFRHPYFEHFSLYLRLKYFDKIKRDKYGMKINCWLNYSFIFPKLYWLTFKVKPR